jgi:signal transduction histidine kinase
MKLDFVSMAAHELRTPVTVIRGYLDVFLDENKARLDNNQSNMISRVYESSRQLASLIDSLLNVSKIEKGTLHLNIENIDWRLYVQDVVKSFKYLTHEKGQKLELVISDSFHVMVECDRLRVSEILGNLINNAITYTPPGGTIRIIVESQRDSVVTHIQDTGRGIPESALPRLFTKFFRVAHTLESSSEGNGLGLYLSKAIVEMHHGNIWVESQVGRGSTFSFSLPKKQPAV